MGGGGTTPSAGRRERKERRGEHAQAGRGGRSYSSLFIRVSRFLRWNASVAMSYAFLQRYAYPQIVNTFFKRDAWVCRTSRANRVNNGWRFFQLPRRKWRPAGHVFCRTFVTAGVFFSSQGLRGEFNRGPRLACFRALRMLERQNAWTPDYVAP